MLLEQRKNAVLSLGEFLSQFEEKQCLQKTSVKNNDLFFEDFKILINLSQSHNGWFTAKEVYFCLKTWSVALTKQNIDGWLSNYKIEIKQQKTVALILAGNIPLVGFHDFLAVLLCGHRVLIKTSSNDRFLLPFLAKYLIDIEPELSQDITFVEGKLENFDAVIATGSNNTSRYFEYYFKNKPSIIRKNRNSVAVLNGTETKEELILLGNDIFRYFGLGCRNISKIFVPKKHSFDLFFEAMSEYGAVIDYKKYSNNYDYNKAVFLMSNYKFLDNGFLILKEDESYASPISCIFYEFYENKEILTKKLKQDSDKLQCVVSNDTTENGVFFGETQTPQLWDYADNIDTISFLLKI